MARRHDSIVPTPVVLPLAVLCVSALCGAIFPLCCTAPLLFPLAFPASLARAEDVVYVTGSDGRGTTRWTGEVLDYSGRELRMRLATGREKVFPVARVTGVSTERSADQQSADEAFAKADYRRAIERYRAALDPGHESRDWVRRQILAQIVWCQQALGQWEQASESFLLLLRAIRRRRCSIAFRWPGRRSSRPPRSNKRPRTGSPKGKRRPPRCSAPAICWPRPTGPQRLRHSRGCPLIATCGSRSWPRRRSGARRFPRPRTNNSPPGGRAGQVSRRAGRRSRFRRRLGPGFPAGRTGRHAALAGAGAVSQPAAAGGQRAVGRRAVAGKTRTAQRGADPLR